MWWVVGVLAWLAIMVVAVGMGRAASKPWPERTDPGEDR